MRYDQYHHPCAICGRTIERKFTVCFACRQRERTAPIPIQRETYIEPTNPLRAKTRYHHGVRPRSERAGPVRVIQRFEPQPLTEQQRQALNLHRKAILSDRQDSRESFKNRS